MAAGWWVVGRPRLTAFVTAYGRRCVSPMGNTRRGKCATHIRIAGRFGGETIFTRWKSQVQSLLRPRGFLSRPLGLTAFFTAFRSEREPRKTPAIPLMACSISAGATVE